jgi:hypothetical protein
VILTVYSEPTRHLYQDARDLANIPGKQARHAVLDSVSPLRSEVDGEVAHFTAELRPTAAAAELMAIPPLGCAADLVDADGVTILSGVVARVSGGGDGYAIEVQA